jgi:hypothetical protein
MSINVPEGFGPDSMKFRAHIDAGILPDVPPERDRTTLRLHLLKNTIAAKAIAPMRVLLHRYVDRRACLE